MKILLSADCFYPASMGGPSQAIYWQAKALAQAGHTVTVVATAYALPPEVPTGRWLTMDCGQVIYTRNPHFYWPINHIWHGWRIIQQADVVHVNSLFYPASLGWVLMCWVVKKPVVWSPHGELSPAALRFRKRLKRIILCFIKRFPFNITFHATSDTEATCIRQQLGTSWPVRIIPNRMELPQRAIPKPVKYPYILFLGRRHPIKALDRLLEALGQSGAFLASSYTLLIVGPAVDQRYERALRTLIERLQLDPKVRFVEPVRGWQKEALYANARLTVLPSHAENFGNVVIESLAQGTPVLASMHTPWSLLNDERVGSWVANDSHSLRIAIEQYVTMPAGEYAGYRERAVQVAQRFDVMANVEEWERFYAYHLATYP